MFNKNKIIVASLLMAFATFSAGFFIGSGGDAQRQVASLLSQNNESANLWQECTKCAFIKTQISSVEQQLESVQKGFASTNVLTSKTEQEKQLKSELASLQEQYENCLQDRCGVEKKTPEATIESVKEEKERVLSCEKCSDLQRHIDNIQRQMTLKSKSAGDIVKLKVQLDELLRLHRDCLTDECPDVAPCQYCNYLESKMVSIEKSLQNQRLLSNERSSLERQLTRLQKEHVQCQPYADACYVAKNDSQEAPSEENLRPAAEPEKEDTQPLVCNECQDYKSQIERLEKLLEIKTKVNDRVKIKETLRLLYGLYEECARTHCPALKVCERCDYLDKEIVSTKTKIDSETNEREKERLQRALTDLETSARICRRDQCKETSSSEAVQPSHEDKNTTPVVESEESACLSCNYLKQNIALFEVWVVQETNETRKNLLKQQLEELRSKYENCVKTHCTVSEDPTLFNEDESVCQDCQKLRQYALKVQRAYDNALLNSEKTKLQVELTSALQSLENCKKDFCS